MNTNDISIDLETLSKFFDAPIIAIGAVAFDRTTGKLGQTFYREVEIESAIKSGRVNGETITFWLTRSPRARNIFAPGKKDSLATVLLAFSDWCRNVGKGVPRVWANGIAQDVTWVEHAMTVGGHGLAVPWHRDNVRDVRTIVELAEETAGFDRKTVKDVGTHHNAIDDATYQANLVSAAYKSMQGKRGAVKTKPAGDDDEL